VAQNPSLGELIRRDDPDAIAGFRDAHLNRVLAYCAEVCSEQLADEASTSAFVQFLARMSADESDSIDLEEELLKATRVAAAGRMDVHSSTSSRGTGAPETVCLALPELLAARANGDIQFNEDEMQQHTSACSICTTTIERLQRAEAGFLSTGPWHHTETVPQTEWAAPVPQGPEAHPPSQMASEPAQPAPQTERPPESEPAPQTERPPESEPAPRTEQPPESEPAPQPERPPESEPAPQPEQPWQVVRARRGGLLGAARRLIAPQGNEDK
jgi:hypothetical protein